MKLLTVTNFFEGHRGGVEIVAGMLARGLADRGLEVCWLAGDAAAAPSGVSFRTDALTSWNVAERRLGFPFPVLSPRAALSVMQEVWAADAVLLHDSLCLPSLCAYLSAKLFLKPVVLVQHIGEVPYRNIVLRGLMKLGDAFVARPLLRFADHVIFISEATRVAYGAMRFNRPPETIYNGVDTSVFHPGGSPASSGAVRAAFGLPPDRPLALFVGRFVEKKGLDLVRHVAAERPDVSWVLAGWGGIDPDGWGLPNVHVVRDRSGPALAELYRASDLLVLPSQGEGFPLVIQEALACGLPVVCGAETVAADPEAACWLKGVEVSGPRSKAGAALSVAIDAALAEARTGDAARAAFARGRYAWTEAADRYATILTTLARTRAKRAAPTPSPVKAPSLARLA